jgi:hypothetical protein
MVEEAVELGVCADGSIGLSMSTIFILAGHEKRLGVWVSRYTQPGREAGRLTVAGGGWGLWEVGRRGARE